MPVSLPGSGKGKDTGEEVLELEKKVVNLESGQEAEERNPVHERSNC